jgi:hypothetical protein
MNKNMNSEITGLQTNNETDADCRPKAASFAPLKQTDNNESRSYDILTHILVSVLIVLILAIVTLFIIIHTSSSSS